MAASIALGCGGKVLVFGLRPWRGKRQAKFVTRFIFIMQRFFCSRRRKPSYGTFATEDRCSCRVLLTQVAH